MVRKKKIQLKFRFLLFVENTFLLVFVITGLYMLMNFSWKTSLIYFVCWILYLFVKDITYDYYFQHKENLKARNSFKMFKRKLRKRGVDFQVEKNENGEKEIKV